MKIHNFNCSLHSHTLLGSFLTPIGFFRNGVSWNDFGYLELAMQNTGFDQLFLSPTALNVDRYRVSVQIRCKKPMVMERIVKNGWLYEKNVMLFITFALFCERILIYRIFPQQWRYCNFSILGGFNLGSIFTNHATSSKYIYHQSPSEVGFTHLDYIGDTLAENYHKKNRSSGFQMFVTTSVLCVDGNRSNSPCRSNSPYVTVQLRNSLDRERVISTTYVYIVMWRKCNILDLAPTSAINSPSRPYDTNPCFCRFLREFSRKIVVSHWAVDRATYREIPG